MRHRWMACEGCRSGERVAQKAHEDNPDLSPTALGNIAVNAATWYGNKALLETTLRAATRKSSKVYEITLKKGDDLDRRAYALYRSLSVGSRKTNPAIDIKTADGRDIKIHMRHKP